MAGIADTNTVDLAAQDVDGNYMLVMIESRVWDNDSDQGQQLMEKINAYTGFIVDGSLARHYPQTVSERVRIRLDCPEPPHGHISHIIAHAAQELSKLDIDFVVNVRPG